MLSGFSDGLLEIPGKWSDSITLVDDGDGFYTVWQDLVNGLFRKFYAEIPLHRSTRAAITTSRLLGERRQ